MKSTTAKRKPASLSAMTFSVNLHCSRMSRVTMTARAGGDRDVLALEKSDTMRLIKGIGSHPLKFF